MNSEEHIEGIRLKGMLPQVFVGEKIPDSDVWETDLTFHRGKFYQVEAASGGGKSSMCSYIYGARNDFKGKIFFSSDENETDSSSFKISDWQKMRRKNIAYLPQELSLFPELSAFQNIRLKNSLTEWKKPNEIDEWLRLLGIDSRRNYPVGKMSVGQQQRVAIIRALCQPFDFIILDEPVSHLDDRNNRLAAQIISEEARRQGAGVISTSVGNPLLLENPIKLHL